MNDQRIAKLSLLLALGVAANLFELILPRIPLLPWLKIGLANIFTIAVIVLYSPLEGLRFALLRTFVAGFLSGVPATSFLFSGVAGIVSAFCMGICWQALGKYRLMGLVGIGIVGAVTHNLAQLGVAYFLFVQNAAFLWQMPFMIFFSVVSGGMIGFLSAGVIGALNAAEVKPISSAALPETFTAAQRCGFPVFIVAIVLIFFVKTWMHFALAFLILLAFTLFSRISPVEIGRRLLAFWGLFAWNIACNLFFTPGKYVLWNITYEGLEQAGVLTLRLAFCIAASAIFMKKAGLQYPLYLFSRVWGSRTTLELVSAALALLPGIARAGRQMKWRAVADVKGFVEQVLAKNR